MSNWQAPKTNWGQPGQTVPGVDDFNRIEGNAQHLNDTLASHKATSATTSQKGHVQLSNSTSSTSTSLAATASAVKTVNDALVSHMADYVLQTGYATTTGSANNYAVTLNPAPASLVEGLCVAVKIHATNTGTSTLNVNGKGAKTIKKPNGNNLVAGNLKAGSIYTVRYNGTNFILQGSDAAGTATPGDVTAGKTFSNDDDTDLVGTLPILGNRSTTLIINGPGTPQVVIPSGRIDQSTIVAKIDPSKASIIKLGETLGGVTGTLKGRATASGTLTFTTTRSNRITKVFLPDFNFYPWLIITHDTLSERCFIGSFRGDSSMPNDFFNNVPRTTGYDISFYRMVHGVGVYYPDNGYLSKTGSYINFNNDYYYDGEKEVTLKWVVIG